MPKKKVKSRVRLEGKAEAQIEMAIEMMKDGADIKTISKYTKLSVSDIENLKNK
jgi:hypothetical protein